MTLRELYHAHFSFVWRTLQRLGVPEADLPDTLQEVFLTVHRRLPDFVGQGAEKAWLFRIALHAARDRRRRAHVRREVFDGTNLDQHPSGRPDALAALERMEDLRIFDKALSDMDMDQRVVFTLFELEGMSGQEVADCLEIPLGTVYSRLRLGRDAFHKAVRRLAARQRAPRMRVGGRA